MIRFWRNMISACRPMMKSLLTTYNPIFASVSHSKHFEMMDPMEDELITQGRIRELEDKKRAQKVRDRVVNNDDDDDDDDDAYDYSQNSQPPLSMLPDNE